MSSMQMQKGRKKKQNNKKSRERTEGSMKTTIADEPTANDRKQQRRQIVKFVKNTLEKGPVGLRTEFASMRRFNDFEKMKAFKEAQEHGKNRYKDVGCLDNSRVKLGSPWPHEYIHANYVSTPSNSKRFICTQAPLEKTCADFWFMCLQDKVETIFMMCNFVEKGSKKCYEYYPSKEKTMEFEEKGQKVTVKYESSTRFKFEKSSDAKVQETILIVEGPNGMSLKTTHYHWIDWPDRGVPPADMAILELLAKARVSKGSIAVHCSAGIGRTGSVVMIEYIMDQLLAGQTIEDSEKILQKIREQRNNSIQTDHQYLFVHQILLNCFEEKKLYGEEVAKAHAGFTKQYLSCLH
uniref:Protein-tyrosine-phosphatase n=1 Tax=Caenorhabditis japonica TaxID=281687 RepID=A0A8R1I9J6_CAEJA